MMNDKGYCGAGALHDRSVLHNYMGRVDETGFGHIPGMSNGRNYHSMNVNITVPAIECGTMILKVFVEDYEPKVGELVGLGVTEVDCVPQKINYIKTRDGRWLKANHFVTLRNDPY